MVVDDIDERSFLMHLRVFLDAVQEVTVGNRHVKHDVSEDQTDREGLEEVENGEMCKAACTTLHTYFLCCFFPLTRVSQLY